MITEHLYRIRLSKIRRSLQLVNYNYSLCTFTFMSVVKIILKIKLNFEYLLPLVSGRHIKIVSDMSRQNKVLSGIIL